MGSFLTTALQAVMAYGVLIGLLWAFIDASRFSKAQFKATKRMGRMPWLFALGAAVVLDFWLGGFRFAEPFGARSLTWFATLLLLLVYAYDMRPRLARQRVAGV